MGTRSATSAHRGAENRLIQRRRQPDRRGTLRWHPHGGDRRQGSGRRQKDNWEAMKAALSRWF